MAIVAHGRFHAFDLARELLVQGHEVTTFSNYPAWSVARFGIGRQHYRGNPLHGVIDRCVRRVPGLSARSEAWQHRRFGRWAARQLRSQSWDVVHCWSGVSEELLRSNAIQARCRVLMRGSAHIAEQDELLRDEEARAGVPIDRPTAWMVAREQREYALADRIVVLSEFARASFARRGLTSDRVSVLPLGVDVGQFRASPADVEARARRVGRGDTLTVMYAGALSARKGLVDLVAIARECANLRMRFTLVGPSMSETEALLSTRGANITVLGKYDQRDLASVYREADLFLFPTVEDGFGMVLTQAMAAGLPILCTTNCAGPDLVTDGRDGWVLPIRSPGAFAERLRWCETHRDELAAMVSAGTGGAVARDWSDVAAMFAAHARTWMTGHAA